MCGRARCEDAAFTPKGIAKCIERGSIPSARHRPDHGSFLAEVHARRKTANFLQIWSFPKGCNSMSNGQLITKDVAVSMLEARRSKLLERIRRIADDMPAEHRELVARELDAALEPLETLDFNAIVDRMVR